MEKTAARLFVGIPLTDELRSGLSAYLRAAFPGGVPGRTVVAANWHLTLRFLGATPDDRRRALLEELRRIGAAAFDLSLGGLGAFPRPARATVLWVGVERGAVELRSLAAEVERSAVAAGFAPERKPYSPHLTVARIDPPADVRRQMAGAPAFGGSMRVSSFTLFRSHLGGGPPRYEPLEQFPLGT